ncbi:hypothetical protein [Amycolatopsis anabasis]|uniref:hypothetical protein n=1 Tax=Amycolatopsis anabasis TaxID=1840409 RepID=UPI00131D6B6B|nr:hypothetical protein [Amycolatopsis anabasis]
MATNTTRKTAAKTAPKAADNTGNTTPANDAMAVINDNAKRGNGDLYGQLAQGATEAEAMPTPTKGNGKPNPLAELVLTSFTENKVYSLPPVEYDEKTVAQIKAAVRRAAASKGLGVNVRHQVQEDGQTVIYLQGKKKSVR